MTHRSGAPRSRGFRRKFLPAGALAAICVSLAAAAQGAEPSSAEPSSQMCQVFAVDGAEGGAQELRATCNGRGLILGEASDYRTAYNEALKATLVDMRLDGERRLLLITIQDDGLPLLEDLSGQIALAAGRGPMSELDGLEIDLGRYLTDGEIAVRPPAGGAAGEKSGEVNIGEQIALERTRRQGAAAQD